MPDRGSRPLRNRAGSSVTLPTMSEAVTTVAILVEPDASQRIGEIRARAHVWVMDTPENRRAVEVLWADQRANPLRTQLTVFNFDSSPPAEVVSHWLWSIDLHHGSYSQSPQWNRAEVHGAHLTPALRADMTSYGFDTYEDTPSGFVATRTKPLADTD